MDNLTDKRAERYLAVVAIIALVTIFVPIIIGALYGWNVWDIEGDYLQKRIRLVSVAFLIAIAPVIEVTRRRKQPPFHQEGYAIAEVIIVISIIMNIAAIVLPSSAFIPNPFVHIEFGSVSVAHTYTVTINFVNTGATSTKVASVLLNDVPYNDSSWAGTIRPEVTGNLTLNSVINVGVSNSGTITFSDDCVYIPSGYRLMAGITVKITINTTGGRDYETSVTLP